MPINYQDTVSIHKYNDVFNSLQHYMFNKENLTNMVTQLETNIDKCNNKYSNHLAINSSIDTNKQNKTSSAIFYPKDKDSLFWCLYIIVQGDIQYEYNKSNRFVLEKELKIKYITENRKHKSLIKTYKIASQIEIESNLGNDNIINMNTFIVLSIIEKINIIVVNKRTYYESLMNDTDELYIIRQNSHGRYGFESASMKYKSEIETNYFQIGNINKPIKSISSYKLDDLTDISQKLKLNIHHDTGKKKKKTELYDDIVKIINY